MTTSASQQTISIAPASPEVHAASRFAITVSVAEVNMAVGRPRHVYEASGEVAKTGVEYTHAFNLSPTAAKQLSVILQTALAQYEEKYGAIPSDAGLSKHMKDVASSSERTARAAPAKKRAK